MTSGPIETKVKAAATGAAAGAGLAELILWIAETRLVGEPMPEPARTFVVATLPTLLAFLAGFWARHTPRTDPAARAQMPPTPQKDDL